MHESAIPLRERNRLETWVSIHEAALALTLEDGLTKATVDAIADRAGVSKRTFFNYFPTKEDAVLGTQAPTVPEEAIAQFRAEQDDVFARTVRLLMAVIRSTIDNGSRATRKKLMAEFPELSRRFKQHVSAAEQLVEELLEERLEHGDVSPEVAALSHTADSTRALLMLAGTVVRFAYVRNPVEMDADNSAAIEDAIEIFREVIKETL